MSRILKAFENKKNFIGYLTAGDQGAEYSTKAALAMIQGGVDILELGVPFSDPIGDGPVIQASSARALKHQTTLTTVLQIAKNIRAKSAVPLILMSYYNPIYQAGSLFYKKAERAGIDGMLIVDLPVEEAQGHLQQMKKYHLDPIFITSPSTSEKRMKVIIEKSKGFIYYACRKGTTGERAALPKDTLRKVLQIKKMTSQPVVVGFGISNAKDAAKILEVADGFVVGSALVKLMEQKASFKELEKKVQQLNPL